MNLLLAKYFIPFDICRHMTVNLLVTSATCNVIGSNLVINAGLSYSNAIAAGCPMGSPKNHVN